MAGLAGLMGVQDDDEATTARSISLDSFFAPLVDPMAVLREEQGAAPWGALAVPQPPVVPPIPGQVVQTGTEEEEAVLVHSDDEDG